MSSYKLTFKLKQHTPIIHFQHDQHGATLRASELKPKLDKFILMKLGKEVDSTLSDDEAIIKGKEIAEKNKWLIGKGEHPALDYKVKIESINDAIYYLPMPFISNSKKKPLINFIKEKMKLDISILAPTPFFANADKIKYARGSDEVNEGETKVEELRFALIIEKKIEIVITTYKPELKENIQKYIIIFFLLNNFGTRQNKGFGSFTIVEVDGKEVIIGDNLLKENFIYKSHESFGDFNGLFKFVTDDYQLLKSGKNFPKYGKSELFKYFIDKNIRWEKRFIKQKINSNKILNKELYWDKKSAPIDVEKTTGNEYNDWADKQTNDYKYIRALLGLAEQFEYTVFAEKKDDKGNWVKANFADNNKKYIISSKHNPSGNADKIERFKSPLFFKVIDGYIYLNINHSYKDILGEEFEFNSKLKGDNKNTSKAFGKLKIPSSFDLSDFVTKHISSNWKKL